VCNCIKREQEEDELIIETWERKHAAHPSVCLSKNCFDRIRTFFFDIIDNNSIEWIIELK